MLLSAKTSNQRAYLKIKAMSNKSLDVRAKQLLCYERRSLKLRLALAVSPHVNSIVRHLSSLEGKLPKTQNGTFLVESPNKDVNSNYL